MDEELSVVGKRVLRIDGCDKSIGKARFIGDIRLPDMLVGKVLRSPYPHAKILKVDTTKAETLPGVEAVITFEDIPQHPFNIAHLDVLLDPGIEAKHRRQYVLCDKARHVGDPIAAVAAVNKGIAEEAVKLIEVEYEQLDAVFDPIEAMSEDAPKIHNYADRNIAEHLCFAFPAGDLEKGFQESDYIIEEIFRTTRQKHGQLELGTSIANFDQMGGLRLWSPSQQPHPTRTQIAGIFDVPEGMVRLLATHIGGAFGARQSFFNEPVCVALAKKAGKAVRLEDNREEDFIGRETRESFVINVKMGVKRVGKIAAIQAKVIANAGAYFSHSGGTTSGCLRHVLGLYRCNNIDGEADIVYTNTPISGGMRGYGNPGATFAREQIIDMAAEKLGMDPLEFRLKNIKGSGEPSSFPSIPIENSDLNECIKVGAEKIGWKKKRGMVKKGVTRRGIGMACNTHGSNTTPGLLENTNAFVYLNADGSANLVVHPCEMGQGILGVLAQIAAEELGLNFEDIHIVTGDTDVTQFNPGSHASRSTYVTGNAVQRAAHEAKVQILERASKALGVPPEELDVGERRVYMKKSPEKEISIAEVARNGIYNYHGDYLNISGSCCFKPQQSNSFQATFAEVEVDIETGRVRVIKVVDAIDCGRAINPMNVEGQLEGAIVQGIGYALTEDFIIDPDTGIPITDNFDKYRMPSTLDIPEIEVFIVGKPVASGPFGAKGVGEIGCVSIAPAIANAVYDAVGVRVLELPITPEKIIEKIRKDVTL